MHNASRLGIVVSGVAMAATLAACASRPVTPVAAYPAATVATVPVYPAATAPVATAPVAAVEFGRVTNIEYMPTGTTTANNRNVLGAIVGGVAGAALGNQVGSGGGRTAATVLGGAAGAAVGSHIGRNAQGATTSAGYRVTIQTDDGGMRVYEVPATGDLRVGDRVRVDNGVIYRS